MLNQPVNVIPSMLSGVGDGVIDATQPLTVSWNVSGDTPMVAYNITIYNNDTVGAVKYTTGKVTLPSPFYGVNQKGEQQTFSATPITASALSTAGIVNGTANGYKLLITQYWGSTDAESITQTSASVFYTKATPTLSIATIANPYNSRILSTTATFSQAQGDTVSFARWVLSDYEDQSNPIYDTGEVQTSLLQFDYDGLFSGTEYILTLTVQSSSGVSVSDSVTFTVAYEISNDVGVVTACRRLGQPYVELTWTARSTIEPTESGESDVNAYVDDNILYVDDNDANVADNTAFLRGEEYGVTGNTANFNTGGTVSVSGGVCTIQPGGSIVYSNFSFGAPWSLAWRGKISNGGMVDVVELGTSGNAFSLLVSPNGLSFTRGSNILFQKDVSIKPSDTLVVVITPNHYYIEHFTFTGGTIPSETLYPSETLFPSDITPVTYNYDGEISYTQDDVSSISLYGYQECEYAWLVSGTFSSFDLENLIGTQWYEPVYDSKTYFLADFSNNTTTAVISGGTGNLIGSSIYRREGDASQLTKIIDITDTYQIFRDYGAKSRTEYQYYVFELGETTYTTTFGSATITPMFDQWCLMECEYSEDDDAYHVQKAYSFACNLNTVAVTNNNSPSLLQNFTKYATRQPVSSQYKSGTLSALIGSVNSSTMTYEDTWELAEEIMELSTSTNPKFLRGMKGELWKVETSAAVRGQANVKSAAMPILVEIPFVEVGDAEGVSIVAMPLDPVFPRDMITQSTIEIDLSTGMMYWTVPNNYVGTQLSISGSDLVETLPDTVAPAELEINTKGYLVATQDE